MRPQGSQIPIRTKKPAGSLKTSGAKKAPSRGPLKVPVAETPKKAPLPPWVWVAIGAAVLLVAWLVFSPARKAVPPPPTAQPAAASSSVAPSDGTPTPAPPAVPTVPPETVGPEVPPAFIQAVRLQPSEPTRLDTLKAVVAAAPGAPEKLTYLYQWKVNDRVIETAQGDTLNLAPFRKKDQVTVTVKPYDSRGTPGFTVESPPISLRSIPPSLELEIKPPEGEAAAAGSPEVRLVGVGPDSEKLTFSFEPPLPADMTLDGATGKITWLREAGRKGDFRFNASVEDDNGTKITKAFIITVK